MIHEAYMPVYIGSRFSLRGRPGAGPPEVVQEALADLKIAKYAHFCRKNHNMNKRASKFCTFFRPFVHF